MDRCRRPQSLAYALTDSPVGQLAWIVERFHDWTDSTDRPNIVRWEELARGGHFAAMEQPDLIVTDLRDALRPYR